LAYLGQPRPFRRLRQTALEGLSRRRNPDISRYDAEVRADDMAVPRLQASPARRLVGILTDS